MFDFHPVHLLLNSTSAEAYLERRDAFRAGAPLDALRCPGYGTRNFYDDLCAAMREAGVESKSDARRAARPGRRGSAHRAPAGPSQWSGRSPLPSGSLSTSCSGSSGW